MDLSTSSESTKVAPQAASNSGPSAVQARGTLTEGEIDLQAIDSIEGAFSFLEKLKESLNYAPVCTSQFRQIVYRCGHLLEALLAESEVLPQVRVQQAAMDIGEVFKRVHRQVVKSSIYGGPKAFVYREDFAAEIAVAHLQMDEVLSSFASDYHVLAGEWEVGYELAKSDDSRLAIEQLESILKDKANLMIIYLLGEDAREEIQASCRAALDNEDLTLSQRSYFEKGIQSHDNIAGWSERTLSQMRDHNGYDGLYSISQAVGPVSKMVTRIPDRETLIERWNVRNNQPGPSGDTAKSSLGTSNADVSPELVADPLADSQNGQDDDASSWMHQPQRE
ncbi:hypothetical protein FRB91_000260 [Serendipita sp. 411]|nr:hypothetical protein FRB91_000260 [Serendipita sp. 411]